MVQERNITLHGPLIQEKAKILALASAIALTRKLTINTAERPLHNTCPEDLCQFSLVV